MPPEPVPGRPHGKHCPAHQPPRLYDPHALYVGGWGDAAILVPYALYKRTGDRKILADNYEMMQKWYAFLLGRAQQTTEEQQTGEYAQYTVLNGLDYGEWCEPGITPMQAMMNRAKAWVRAYLAYSGRLLAEIAQALGKAEDAAQYRDTAEKARLAYHAAFTDHGKSHPTGSVNMSVPLHSVCWMKLRAKPLRIR